MITLKFRILYHLLAYRWYKMFDSERARKKAERHYLILLVIS